MRRKHQRVSAVVIATAFVLGKFSAGAQLSLTVTSAADSGPGSLREAIHLVNSEPYEVIRFAIPPTNGSVRTIVLLSNLPPLLNRVTIDGSTQPGFLGRPIIELDGRFASTGLSLVSGSNQIRSLVLNGFGDGNGPAIVVHSGFNSIQRNYLGTGPSGTNPVPNGIGVLLLGGANNNSIGGLSAGNLISGNARHGIEVLGEGNQIQGNFIGTDITGTNALGNGQHGISLNASSNTVGGVGRAAGNVIAFNGSNGVAVINCTCNAILRNSIFGNAGLGIDVGADGPTAIGAPRIISASAIGGTTGIATRIRGTLESTPDGVFRIEFFSNLACDPSGFGEGENFEGSTIVTNDPSGRSSFDVGLPPLPAGLFVTATATDITNNMSSEFSACARVTAQSPPVAVADSTNTLEDVLVDIRVLDNDSNADGDPFFLSATTTNGVVTPIDRVLRFTPALNFYGTVTLNYTISNTAGTSSASVTVIVTPVNDPPGASNDVVTTVEDTPVTINVLANDPDVDGDALSIDGFSLPANGTVRPDGTNLVFTPARDFSGVVSFTYTNSDRSTGASAVVMVTVLPVNDPPVAVNDATNTPENISVLIDALANDSDVEGGLLFITNATAMNGTVEIVGPGLFFTPATNFFGDAVVHYTVSDGTNTASAIVLVNVTPVRPDLTGTWQGTFSCRCAYTEKLAPYLVLRGTLTVTNAGSASAPGTLVKFFLSDDSVLDPRDIFLSRALCRPLAIQQARRIAFVGKLPPYKTAVGKQIIAVVNADFRTRESYETNNHVVLMIR